MKSIFRTSLLLFCIALYGVPSEAQDSIGEKGPGPVILISRDKNGQDEIVNVFKETQRQHFHDPGIPRFLLADRKRKWALGVGGYVQAVVEYDFGGISDDIDFFPAFISGGKPRSQFQMDITTSTLFLKLVGRVGKWGNIIVYTAGNWRGDGNTFELQNAYVQFLGITFGYDTGTFMDLAAGPPTIDFAGPCGMTSYRTTLVRYERTLGKGFSVGIALEMPGIEGATDRYTSVDHQLVPSVPAYVQYGWNKGRSHIRLSGIYRNIAYTDLANDKSNSQTGWGVQATSVVAIGKPFQIYLQYAYGKGIGSLINDISNLSVDIVSDVDNVGKMQLLPMSGWYAGVQYNFTPKIFMSATYSQSMLHAGNYYRIVNPEQYKHGQYLVTNLFWNVIPDLQLGMEYLHGWRKDFDKNGDQANRINLSAKFSF